MTGLIAYCGRDSMSRDLVMPAVYAALRGDAEGAWVLPGPGAPTTGAKLAVLDTFSDFLAATTTTLKTAWNKGKRLAALADLWAT